MIGATVAYTLAIAVAAWSLWALIVRSARMGARRLTGLNDGDTAQRYFLLLLGQARSKMVVYDDGNDVEDSIYADPDVVRAIKEKFVNNPNFTMQCLFNCPVPEALYSIAHIPEIDGRMDVRTTGLGEEAPRDTHMKIIDDGRMAYLTRHGYGSMVRPYELVDCLTVASWTLKSVARAELGDCMSQFDQKFQQAYAT